MQYIKFNTIKDAQTVSKEVYKLFTNKSEDTKYLYHFFKCNKGFGWLEIPKGKLTMKHNRKSNFNYVFTKLKEILDPIFKTPMDELKPQMIDEHTYDLNGVFIGNCDVKDLDYLYTNGHIDKPTEIL